MECKHITVNGVRYIRADIAKHTGKTIQINKTMYVQEAEHFKGEKCELPVVNLDKRYLAKNHSHFVYTGDYESVEENGWFESFGEDIQNNDTPGIYLAKHWILEAVPKPKSNQAVERLDKLKSKLSDFHESSMIEIYNIYKIIKNGE